MLKRLTQPQVVAMRCAGDAWPRALLSETPIPDTWMGLLLKADGRRRFVPAGEDPRPERGDTLILVRNRAITVPIEVRGAPASDDHLVDASVELLVRCAAREDELAACGSTLLATGELTLEGLARALQQAGVEAAVRRFVQARATKALLKADQRDAVLKELQAELKPFLFSSGMLLERLGAVRFSSASYDDEDALRQATQQRVREIEAREMVERAALAATHRRLDELGSVLGKLKAAATADGNARWRDLLLTLSPGDRGRLLESLWRLTPDRATTEAIVAITDRECVWLDPQNPDEIGRRVALPTALGGARAVEFEAVDGTLLIGAAGGVWRIQVSSGAVLEKYAVPANERPRTGFNAIARSGGHLFATHSQLGCWSWPLDQPDAPRAILAPSGGLPKTVRAARATADGHVLYAADSAVYVLTRDGEPRHAMPIDRGAVHALAVLDRSVYAATDDGLLVSNCWESPDVWQVVHRRSEPIESLEARRWDDLVELVVPAGAEGVLGVYTDEGVVARLLDVRTPVRRAWAADDALVALSEQRDRLTILTGAMPARTGREVLLARRLGRSIQDVCLVTRNEGGPT